MHQKYERVSIQPPAQRESYYRVQVGRFSDLEQAQQEAQRLKQAGYPGAFVVAMDDTAH
jgi:cell division protein FtsN